MLPGPLWKAEGPDTARESRPAVRGAPRWLVVLLCFAYQRGTSSGGEATVGNHGLSLNLRTGLNYGGKGL